MHAITFIVALRVTVRTNDLDRLDLLKDLIRHEIIETNVDSAEDLMEVLDVREDELITVEEAGS